MSKKYIKKFDDNGSLVYLNDGKGFELWREYADINGRHLEISERNSRGERHTHKYDNNGNFIHTDYYIDDDHVCEMNCYYNDEGSCNIIKNEFETITRIFNKDDYPVKISRYVNPYEMTVTFDDDVVTFTDNFGCSIGVDKEDYINLELWRCESVVEIADMMDELSNFEQEEYDEDE